MQHSRKSGYHCVEVSDNLNKGKKDTQMSSTQTKNRTTSSGYGFLEMKRSSYLTSKAMRYFLVATILTTAVQQLNVVVDGIVVSNFVGPDALSATNLYQPLSLFVSAVCTLFGIGATIFASKLMGKQDSDGVNKVLSSAFSTLIVVGILFAVAANIFSDDIVRMICHVDQLEPYFRSYAIPMLSCSIVNLLSMFLDQTVSIDGKPQVASKSVAISATANIIMDLCFVGWLQMGVAGSAYATILSQVLNILILSGTLFSSRCSITLRPLRFFSITKLYQGLQYGLPLIISNMVLMLLFLFLNNTIQSEEGADGMFALSVCMNLLSISMMITGGVGSTLLSVGSFLGGQRDYRGIRFLVYKGLQMELAVLAVIVGISELCPSLLTSLFGADTEALALYSEQCLRIFAWMLLAVMPVILLANVYQMLGHLVLSPLIVLMFPVSLVPSLMLCARIGGDATVWYGFPLAGVAVVLLVVLTTEIFRRRKQGNLSFVTLIPAAKQEDVYDVSIPYDRDSVTQGIVELKDYVDSQKISPKLREEIQQTVVAVMEDVMERAGERNGYFDVRIWCDDDSYHASVKDDCPRQDTTTSNNNHSIAEYEYKFMYGQNMMFMKYSNK